MSSFSAMNSSTANTDDGGYVAMDHFKSKKLVPVSKAKNMEDHYKTPSFPRPVTIGGRYDYGTSTFGKTALFGSVSSRLQTPSSPPPLPLSSPPQEFTSIRPTFLNRRSVLIPVKPPQVPTHFAQSLPKIKTSINKCNVCSACSTSNVVQDDVQKALDELSELISLTTEDITDNVPPLPTTLPPPSTPFYTTPWSSSPLVPGYVQPISKEWEDLNTKLNMLVINVRAQNKKIDEIRRVCVDKSDYVSFDELDDLIAQSSTTLDVNQKPTTTLPSSSKHLTLPYVSCASKNSHQNRSWGQKLIGCVKFGKNKR